MGGGGTPIRQYFRQKNCARGGGEYPQFSQILVIKKYDIGIGNGILSNTLLLGGFFLLDVFREKNPPRGGGKGATPEFRQIF